MRPQIPETLEEAIKEVYKEAGYGTETELVRDAIRQHIDRLESGNFGVEKAFAVRGDEYDDGVVHIGDNRYADNQTVRGNLVTADGSGANGLVFGMLGSGNRAGAGYLFDRALRAHDDLRIIVVDPLESFDVLASNIESSQRIDIDTTTPLGLFSPVTGGADTAFHAQAIHSVRHSQAPFEEDVIDVQKLAPIVEPLVSEDNVVDAFVEPLQSEDPSVSLSDEAVIEAMAATKPFVSGQYKRLQREARFDISAERFTYLKTTEGTTVGALLAAYRQAKQLTEPTIIAVNEVHSVLSLFDNPSYTTLLEDAAETNVGFFGLTNSIDVIDPRTLRTMFKTADHTLGFRTKTIGDEQAFQLDIGTREREYLSSLSTGKSDNIEGIELLYHGRGGEWCPIVITPSDDEIERMFTDA